MTKLIDMLTAVSQLKPNNDNLKALRNELDSHLGMIEPAWSLNERGENRLKARYEIQHYTVRLAALITDICHVVRYALPNQVRGFLRIAAKRHTGEPNLVKLAGELLSRLDQLKIIYEAHVRSPLYGYAPTIVEDTYEVHQALVIFIDQHAIKDLRKAARRLESITGDLDQLQKSLDLGGHPEGKGSPVVAAIRRVGQPFYDQYPQHWAKIRNLIWDSMQRRPKDPPLTQDQLVIYGEWKHMSERFRRRQVETAFADS